MFNLEHPEITWAERTGYPSWAQPEEYSCELCGDEIYEDDIYEDDVYDCLCEHCLLKLHRKSP